MCETARTLRFKNHIPGLDVLRGLAITMVVMYHGVAGRAANEHFAGWRRAVVYLTGWGASGVHLFFVLSGFLITGIILDGRTASTRTFFFKFYKRRSLRILPAYFLMLIVLKAMHIVSWKFVLAAVLFIANMASAVGAHSGEYGPLWSLGVEEQFYLLWPWLARRLPLRRLAIFTAALSAALMFAEVAMAIRYPEFDAKTKLWNNAAWLLAGALIAIGLRDGFIRRDNIARIITGCLIGAFLTSPIVYLVDARHVLYFDKIFRLPFVLAFVTMLLWAILKNSETRVAPPNWLAHGLAFLGYISYSLYLVHQLIFILFDKYFSGTWIAGRTLSGLATSTAACLAVAVLVAYLSRRYFEALFLGEIRIATPPLTAASESSDQTHSTTPSRLRPLQ